MPPPLLGLGGHGAVAPVGGVDTAFFFQDIRPDGQDDLQEFEGDLPMFGQFVAQRHEVLKAVGVQALGRDLIHQAAQFLGQAQSLIGRVVAVGAGQDQARQQGLAFHPRQGGGNFQPAQGIFLAAQRQVVLVQITQRRQLRQQHRSPAGAAQKGFGQGADGGRVGSKMR